MGKTLGNGNLRDIADFLAALTTLTVNNLSLAGDYSDFPYVTLEGEKIGKLFWTENAGFMIDMGTTGD